MECDAAYYLWSDRSVLSSRVLVRPGVSRDIAIRGLITVIEEAGQESVDDRPGVGLDDPVAVLIAHCGRSTLSSGYGSMSRSNEDLQHTRRELVEFALVDLTDAANRNQETT